MLSTPIQSHHSFNKKSVVPDQQRNRLCVHHLVEFCHVKACYMEGKPASSHWDCTCVIPSLRITLLIMGAVSCDSSSHLFGIWKGWVQSRPSTSDQQNDTGCLLGRAILIRMLQMCVRIRSGPAKVRIVKWQQLAFQSQACVSMRQLGPKAKLFTKNIQVIYAKSGYFHD